MCCIFPLISLDSAASPHTSGHSLIKPRLYTTLPLSLSRSTHPASFAVSRPSGSPRPPSSSSSFLFPRTPMEQPSKKLKWSRDLEERGENHFVNSISRRRWEMLRGTRRGMSREREKREERRRQRNFLDELGSKSTSASSAAMRLCKWFPVRAAWR